MTLYTYLSLGVIALDKITELILVLDSRQWRSIKEEEEEEAEEAESEQSYYVRLISCNLDE